MKVDLLLIVKRNIENNIKKNRIARHIQEALVRKAREAAQAVLVVLILQLDLMVMLVISNIRSAKC